MEIITSFKTWFLINNIVLFLMAFNLLLQGKAIIKLKKRIELNEYWIKELFEFKTGKKTKKWKN